MTAYSPHGVTNMTNHEIFVDAGCIWIGDPSYIMGQDADFNVNNWLDDFASKINFTNGVDSTLGHGIGLCITSGYGDGRYPVKIEYCPHTKRVARVIIEFIEDES